MTLDDKLRRIKEEDIEILVREGIIKACIGCRGYHVGEGYSWDAVMKLVDKESN